MAKRKTKVVTVRAIGQQIPAIDGPARLRGPNIHVLEDFNESTAGKARRYRALPAEHPLIKAWLRRNITEEQFNAGNRYRVLFEKANDPSGIDSTQLMAINRGNGNSANILATGEKASAQKAIRTIERKMGIVDRAIVHNFCGLGLPMGSSVRNVVDCTPNGYSFRVREALDDLIRATKSVIIPDFERDVAHKIA